MKKALFLAFLFCFQPVFIFSEDSGAKITFGENSFEFGEILQGNKVTHKFPFKNEGGQTLKVDRVQTSCGCTAAVAGKKELAPQEASEIDVTYNSAGRSGEVNKSIYVFSNDAQTPRYELKIHGSIVTLLSIEPAVLNLGTVALGQSVEKEIKLKLTRERAPLKIMRVEKSGHVEWTPADGVISGQNETVFKLKFTPDPRLGFVSERVTLHFDDPSVFPVNIPLSGRVEGPITVFPMRINFFMREGQVSQNIQKITVTNNVPDPLNIEKIEYDDQVFDVQTTVLEQGKKYEIAVSIKAGIQEKFINKLLKIHTNQAALPVIDIPAQVWNQPNPSNPQSGVQQQQPVLKTS
jgi:hypothetical protein